MGPTSGCSWPRLDQSGWPFLKPSFMASATTYMTPMYGTSRMVAFFLATVGISFQFLQVSAVKSSPLPGRTGTPEETAL